MSVWYCGLVADVNATKTNTRASVSACARVSVPAVRAAIEARIFRHSLLMWVRMCVFMLLECMGQACACGVF